MIFISCLFFILALLTLKYKNKGKNRAVLEAFLIFIFGSLTLLYFVSSYFSGNGINETILATINLGVQEAGFSEYAYLIAISFIALIAIFALSFFYFFQLKKFNTSQPKKLKAFLHNSFLITAFLCNPAIWDIKTLYQSMNLAPSDEFYLHYKTPDLSNLNTNKKNLLIIYAESLERSYLDNDNFNNLTPKLNETIKKYNAIEFSNITQTNGSNYTIAGITSTQCGIPLFTTSGGNSMEGVDKFYPKAICLGDILKKASYNLSFMQGSSTKFSGIDKFYKTHGFDSIQGKDELEKKLKNIKYQNGWGLYDDSLFELGWEEFLKLSKRDEKFALVLHTIDTHHPSGHLSASCKKNLYLDGSNDMLNCVKCSDTLISNFIERIKASAFSSNTIIVVVSDHLAMRNTASKQLEKIKDRRDLFVIFDTNSTSYQKIQKDGTPFDFTPTILDFLGIDTAVGLGRNLNKEESIYSNFSDYDSKLNSFRYEILKFWEFPELPKSIFIDLKKSLVSAGKKSYSLPIFFKVEKESLHPFFEYNKAWTYHEQLQHFSLNDEFLWVDKCDKLNMIFQKDLNSSICVAEGIFGSKYKLTPIDDSTNYEIKNLTQDFFSIDTNELVQNIESLKNNGIKYKADIKDGILFKKDGFANFLRDIKGLSYKEKIGRWSDSKLNENVELIFEKPLPKNFTMKMKMALNKDVDKILKVKVGDDIKELGLNLKEKEYSLAFDNNQSVSTITIIPPKKIVHKELLEGDDERDKRVLLVEIKIL